VKALPCFTVSCAPSHHPYSDCLTTLKSSASHSEISSLRQTSPTTPPPLTPRTTQTRSSPPKAAKTWVHRRCGRLRLFSMLKKGGGKIRAPRRVRSSLLHKTYPRAAPRLHFCCYGVCAASEDHSLLSALLPQSSTFPSHSFHCASLCLLLQIINIRCGKLLIWPRFRD
jgi:hypothetical protein